MNIKKELWVFYLGFSLTLITDYDLINWKFWAIIGPTIIFHVIFNEKS